MHLENLSLAQFKNYKSLKTSFSTNINCLVGENGSGKTNLLDAIFYLSFTKSAFNPVDIQNIQHDLDFFSIIGDFLLDDKTIRVRCSLVKGEKKKIFYGKKQLEKASEHVGNFPVVMIAPNDISLILEGSETRRKFFDSLIAQFDKVYLEKLIHYNHALKQRNSLLKQMAEGEMNDQDLLEPYDDILIRNGNIINKKRSEFAKEFRPILLDHYKDISQGKEEVSLKYISEANAEDFDTNFKNALQRDMTFQRTTLGIHRDDFGFEIDSYPLKKFGSQGQQKSFLIAIKLAQFEILIQKKGFKPILLLDDIFDKLDDLRIEKLVKMIINNSFGQVFITDARPERTKHFLSNLNTEIRVFTVDQGEIKEESHV